MGFLATLDESIAAIALQSVKELEGKMNSFEPNHPPWGLCPGCSVDLDQLESLHQ
jgi:hypothetical protein